MFTINKTELQTIVQIAFAKGVHFACQHELDVVGQKQAKKEALQQTFTEVEAYCKINDNPMRYQSEEAFREAVKKIFGDLVEEKIKSLNAGYLILSEVVFLKHWGTNISIRPWVGLFGEGFHIVTKAVKEVRQILLDYVLKKEGRIPEYWDTTTPDEKIVVFIQGNVPVLIDPDVN